MSSTAVVGKTNATWISSGQVDCTKKEAAEEAEEEEEEEEEEGEEEEEEGDEEEGFAEVEQE